MALDRSLVLREGLPGVPAPDLARVLALTLRRERQRHSGARIGQPGAAALWPLGFSGEENLSAFVPGPALGSLPRIADQLIEGVRSPYAILDDHGILLINSARATRDSAIQASAIRDSAIRDSLILAGGSYCTVSLQRGGDRWTVAKSVAKDGAGADIDSLRRHQNEAEWLCEVSRFSPLFAPVVSVADEQPSYTFASEFFPGYSAAELLFHGNLTGEALAGILICVYEELRGGLYTRKPLAVRWLDTDRTYVEKIRRRERSLLTYLGGARDQLAALLTARRVSVNGRECPPMRTLLSVVDSDPRWQPVIHPRARHACHGDLILEDILVAPGALGVRGARDIRLIDPNPYNTSALHDLAKTVLSLWLGYELVYFDMFELSATVSDTGEEVAVHVSLKAPDYRKELQVAAERFMAYAYNEFAVAWGLAERDFRRLVRMAAALAALAIPAFHVIAHGRPDRALAFASLGLLHASYALTDTESPDIGIVPGD